jgi:hypothetical protein
MLKKILVAAAISTMALPAFAVDSGQVKSSIALKDGSMVYIFKDGKMGMEDKLGRAIVMRQGIAMDTKDGKKIIMNGNEIWRVQELLHKMHDE